MCISMNCIRRKTDLSEECMPRKSIEDVLKMHTDSIMTNPGVIGTAIGEQNGKPCIIIMITEKTDQIIEHLPSNLEGYPVVIKDTGQIRARERK